jgi:ATP-dependent DNA ligase
VFRDGDEILLQSRDEKPMNRYFPELIAPLAATLSERCVVDGEIVIVGVGGLDFETLKADGSFAGTQETTRDIELATNADEYTGTATSEFFNAADQVISTGCATSTATRLE